MILTKDLQYCKYKKDTLDKTQRIEVKCDICEKVWNLSLYTQINGYKKYNKDLCRGCKHREQYVLGIRNSNHITQYNKLQAGKTLEERLGEEKAKIAKEKMSKASSGENNANFGAKFNHGFGHGALSHLGKKGSTYEIMYGFEKAQILKQNCSKNNKGEKNPMFGKPSPQGSGNGWSGWYKGWFFRSLKELSFMINVIERFKFKWDTCECKNLFKISYIDYNGINKNYFPDFILNDKYVVEIKPKHLWNSINVVNKKNAAELWCKEHGYKYKLIDIDKKINLQELNKLINIEEVNLIDRYKIKLKEYSNLNKKL